jgi:hypothetical protein
MNDLMQKLAISKKIMDKHNNVPRNQNQMSMVNENITANYNIPEEILESSKQKPRIQETITTKPINQNAVMNSKLPDEIKKLMIENPIVQPQLNGPTLSDEIIEGAARLMGNQNKKSENTIVNERHSPTNNNDLKKMIRDVVRDTVRDVIKEELQNAGLLTETTQNTNEILSLRVGKHVFEGKVLKIKKVK